MRKKGILALLLALIMCVSMSACGGSGSDSSEFFTIDAVCVDDSSLEDGVYTVYLFTTVSTDSENLSVDSKSSVLTVNDTNTYEPEHFMSACAFVGSYYYSDYLEDVNVGTSLKVVSTYRIPAGDLEAGKTVKLENHQVPGADGIAFETDIIVHYENEEAMAKEVDPDGYAAEVEARTPADAATVSQAQSLMNGYYWDFYVNNMSYEIEFYAPNEFEIRTSGFTNTGTYSVDKGYIELYYPSNQNTVYVPYVFEAGDIDLDVVKAFDYSD